MKFKAGKTYRVKSKKHKRFCLFELDFISKLVAIDRKEGFLVFGNLYYVYFNKISEYEIKEIKKPNEIELKMIRNIGGRSK